MCWFSLIFPETVLERSKRSTCFCPHQNCHILGYTWYNMFVFFYKWRFPEIVVPLSLNHPAIEVPPFIWVNYNNLTVLPHYNHG